MKVIELDGYGGVEVLRLGERPVPVPGRGELLIQVRASGVNRPDVLQRLGNYPVPAGASDILGLEVAGTIENGDAAELAAAGFSRGDRVCALVTGGGYAEFCVAPIAQCLPVPEGLSDVEAASLPETFFTVWSNMVDRAGLQSGETVLIQGGSSGIGVAAIQLAKYRGATVIVTAGSDSKCESCLALGADFAINYKAVDFQTELMRLTDGHGVDVILDMVAGSYVAKEVQCLKEDGRLVIISVLGGIKSELNAGLVLRRRLTITGSTLRPRSVAFKAAIAQACLKQVWPALAAGHIKPVVYRRFAADDVVLAHTLMESSQHVGKIVLTWGEP
ncbi:MAG: NAD(P)H-quinone oxidoreductase [Rhodoferax sp.]|jgi:NADPH2:quinone reductase|uniref:NAD(P)H-quinone oxidoreductase n=1 Tax=Rhodoferax sp. TaxID=50421 RepID=UPI001B5079A4|nr:NAD(P)H-quinone oxidoreductase [Rhodoferax sp.]MBP8286867.1 NAD(P)H-quinone oxidoreductase [Rhodoferax sp.]MBP9149056.1 NAD(P)H-quinone oxidoreductase [Rhodoferax sp.]MBP9735827.1 NAD(P)H-quinone oxidoreductase [Rhodoferax sp.]